MDARVHSHAPARRPVECLYAGLFYHAVAGATTGDKGVWFAAPNDPRFTFINRLTATFDALLYGFLVAFLAVAMAARRAMAGTKAA